MARSSISRSVQFVGIAAVVKAYQSRNVAPWSIFCNDQFMFKYDGHKIADGAQLLAATLSDIEQTMSPAVYTLKVYEELPRAGKIKSNTPDDGSFNFRVVEAADQVRIGGYDPGVKVLMDKINALELRIAQSDAATDEGDDTIGTIERVMEIPGVREVITTFMSGLFGSRPSAIAGVPGAQSEAGIDDNEKIYLSESMMNSLNTLMRVDNNLELHLHKLAMMAEQSPAKYKMLAAML